MTPLAALSVAIQHTSFQEAATICKLLTTSSTVRLAIQHHCAGQLPLNVFLSDVAKVRELAVWLRSNARLLQSFEISLHFKEVDAEELAASHVAEALHEAATVRPLQLQSLKSQYVSGFLLRQLPADSLKQLDINWHGDSAACSRAITDGLSRLSGLRDLTILGSPAEAHGGLTLVLSTLANLTALTQLVWYAEVHDLRLLEQVPHQLQHLSLGLARAVDNPCLDGEEHTAVDPQYPAHLGHLTALTYLDGDGGANHYIVRQGDVLPTSLRVLHASDCASCEPLLQLQQLQELKLSITRTHAQQLQLLSRLTALTGVDLRYYDEDEDDVAVSSTAAAAWGVIPGLTQLSIWCNHGDTPLSEAVPQGLAQISGLQCLDIMDHYMTRATAVQLMKAIQQLTVLQSLQLTNLRVYKLEGQVETAEPPENAVAGTYGRLSISSSAATVIAGLPKLTCLSLCEMPLREGAAAALARASQLTSLSLCACGLDSDMVRPILKSMSGLQSLDLMDNKGLFVSCVPSIMQLSQLTYLGLEGTGMCIFDLECLAKLTTLKSWRLPDMDDVP